MAKAKLKNYGWVLQIEKQGYFLGLYMGIVRSIRSAAVYSTRKEARNKRIKGETVRKVELFKNGRAKKVLPERCKYNALDSQALVISMCGERLWFLK